MQKRDIELTGTYRSMFQASAPYPAPSPDCRMPSPVSGFSTNHNPSLGDVLMVDSSFAPPLPQTRNPKLLAGQQIANTQSATVCIGLT